jgi:phosphate transport system substrate-binding protein
VPPSTDIEHINATPPLAHGEGGARLTPSPAVAMECALDFVRNVVAAGFVATAALAPAEAAEVAGAGATFPYPIYAKWAEAYNKETGTVVRYAAVGSGEGIRRIQNKEVTFGASDMPLGIGELDMGGLVQFPTVVGGIAVVVNLDGIKTGDLTLDGPTIARIFLGEIKSWNDGAIRKLNPNLKLPSQPIKVVHRSDGSGTTFAFTDYLSKVSADWKLKVGSITSVEWPTGLGANGNGGVADMVAQIAGSIGYVEYAYAKENKLASAKLINRDGKAVVPTVNAFAAAAGNADWEGRSGFGVILSNEPGAASWPIAGASFILMHKQPDDPAAASAALKFFDWAYAKGGKMAEDLDYVPMPVVDVVRKLWASEIKDGSGKLIYAISR